MSRPFRAVFGLATIAIASGPGIDAAAQERPAIDGRALEPGRVMERLASPLDATQTFSLYLPSGYRPDRRWPVVLLFDPRGRARLPLDRMVPAAEELGYVLASSTRSASDVPGDPNPAAARAMLAAVEAAIPTDPERTYLYGMSGTARSAWTMAFASPERVAGIAGFGAGPPPGFDLEAAQARHGAAFVVFAGAGDADFNHAELVVLEPRLRRLGFRFRTAYYRGPHGWPGEPVFRRSLEWMHLMAMLGGLAEPDPGWIAALRAAWSSEASDDVRNDRLPEAWARYRSIVRDFGGLADVAAEEREAARLAELPAVREWRRRRGELARAHLEARRINAEKLVELARARVPLDSAVRALAIDSLSDAAGDAADTASAAAARRVLVSLSVVASAYAAPRFLAAGDTAAARFARGLADRIRPALLRDSP